MTFLEDVAIDTDGFVLLERAKNAADCLLKAYVPFDVAYQTFSAKGAYSDQIRDVHFTRGPVVTASAHEALTIETLKHDLKVAMADVLAYLQNIASGILCYPDFSLSVAFNFDSPETKPRFYWTCGVGNQNIATTNVERIAQWFALAQSLLANRGVGHQTYLFYDLKTSIYATSKEDALSLHDIAYTLFNPRGAIPQHPTFSLTSA